MSSHANRAKLIDVQERRQIAESFEFREIDTDEGTRYILRGYAATWEPYDCYGGPEMGGWVEQLNAHSFRATLANKPDVMLLINHEGLPIAGTKNDTLLLATDNHGLLVRAELDPDDIDVQRIAPKMKSRNGMRPLLDEMSFSFRVKDQVWNTDYSHRNITELSLQKGDVSVVNYGMNPKTRVSLSSTVGALASLSNKELAEVRGMEREELAAAMATLQRAWRANNEPDEKPDDKEPDDDADEEKMCGKRDGFGGKKAPPFGKGKPDEGDDEGDEEDAPDDDEAKAWVNFDGSHLLYQGQCVTCAGQRAKPGKYGSVAYADPGYLDSSGKPAKGGNGVPRYPIDEKHVQAAWSYINMPKNQKGYTASQLSAIKGKIKSAMKKHGHDVSDDKKSFDGTSAMMSPDDIKALEAQGGNVSHVEQVRKFGGGVTLVAVMDDGTRIPLPSFRQSGQQYSTGVRPQFTDQYTRAECPGGEQCPGESCPEHGDEEKAFDGQGPVAVNIEGGPHKQYDWKPGVDDNKIDTHNTDYTKEDLGELDAGELHGKAISGARGHVIDAISDEEEQDEFDDEVELNLSVDDRLSALRGHNELPNRPTVEDAAAFLRQLA